MENFDKEKLRLFVDRIEKLQDERKIISDDMKSVYDEAKNVGYSPQIIRKVIRIRRADKDQLANENELISLYMHAIEGDKDEE